MNIIYMGTPEFAVPPLKEIIAAGHRVSAVFTQPDKPKGRGYKLAPPPVKELALEHDIPVYQNTSLKDGEALKTIESYAPDLIVVVAYGKILPKEILSYPKYGCVNLHASLLPKYRGAGPIQWSVIDGCKEVGVTAMLMAEGLDTGDMLTKVSTELMPEETAGELHDRLSILGSKLITDTIISLEKGEITPQPQIEEHSSYAPMLNKAMAKLDFNKDAITLHNLIRGVNPWPVAHTTFEGKLLKVYRAEIAEGYSGNAGEILDEKNFIIGCCEGALKLTEIQSEGAKRMPASQFLMGKAIKKGDYLG